MRRILGADEQKTSEGDEAVDTYGNSTESKFFRSIRQNYPTKTKRVGMPAALCPDICQLKGSLGQMRRSDVMGELCGFACPVFARLMKRCFYFILLKKRGRCAYIAKNERKADFGQKSFQKNERKTEK